MNRTGKLLTGLALLAVPFVIACTQAQPNEIIHPTPDNLPAAGSPVIRAADVPAELGTEELAEWKRIRDALLMNEGTLASLGRLGTMQDRDAPDIFGFELDVALNHSGQLVVLDRRNYAVKIFNLTGEHVATFGRAGSGPGEFRDPNAVEVLSDGQIVVLDRGNRINLYAPHDSGYAYATTHIVKDVVPERACSLGDRIFSSGWRRLDNTMIHEIPVTPDHSAQHFGRGYKSGEWLVQDQLSDGPIACLEDPARVVLAFDNFPVLRAHDANTGALLWESLLDDYSQRPIVQELSPTGGPRVSFPKGEGARDAVAALLAVNDDHLLLQTARGETPSDPSEQPEIQIRSYLVHAPSGQGALISDTLPMLASITNEYYVAIWVFPFPRLEVVGGLPEGRLVDLAGHWKPAPFDPNELQEHGEMTMPLTGWKQASAALILGVTLGVAGAIPVPSVDIRWNLPALRSMDYMPEARRDSGTELLFVVIGSSGCRWSNTPEFIELVRNARDAVRNEAKSRGIGFATLGLSQDHDAAAGIEYLETFGAFDEIAVGRGWRNTGLNKYMYNEFPGPAATPQILVITRDISGLGGQWEFVNETVLVRLIGSAEIRSWLQGGAGVS